jgi:hypothetical protein
MGWLALKAFGRSVAVEGPHEALDVIRDRLPPFYRETSGRAEANWSISQDGDGWTVRGVHFPLSHVRTVEGAVEVLLSDLELWIAEQARARIFVHAGCVVVGDRAVVLPGRTMSGKSSLVAALVRSGATYYSDEFAVLDSKGLVRPYARAISLRPYDGGPARRVTVEALGGRAGRGPATIGLVAVLQRDADQGWQIHEVTRGQAILSLIDNTVAARSRPRAMLTALTGATSEARLITGTRGDAADAAERIIGLLRSVPVRSGASDSVRA